VVLIGVIHPETNMRVLGIALVALACLIGIAAIADVLGPFFEARGIPVSGSVYPWYVWAVAGILSLAGGLALWRRADAREVRERRRPAAPPGDSGNAA
jgi:hypothetical protein